MATAAIPAVQARVQRRVGSWYERVTTRWCYVFLIPSIILTGLFTFYPMVMSWVYSLMQWSGFTSDMTFIGLANYVELVQDPFFWRAFGRSAIFMAVGTPVQVVLALLLAIVLNHQALKLSPIFRTMFFLPVMGSAAVLGVILNFLVSPNDGPLNALLTKMNVPGAPVDFLSPHLALWTVLAAQVWKNLGTTLIYWLAALQTIPQDYLEAAEVDGAGRWALLRHIRVPLLLPFAMIIIVLTAKENLHAFALVQAMTEGGPYYASQVIEVYIYQTAFQPTDQTGGVPRLGYASAAGCFFGTATLLITLVQLWVARKVMETRAEMRQVRGVQP